MVRPLWALCVLLAVVSAAAAVAKETEEQYSSYIVHVAHKHAPLLPRRGGLLATGAYASFLRDYIPVDMSDPAPTVFYSYSHAATGFAARLTRRQAAHLASRRSAVLAVVPDAMRQLHTTLTPSFLGLSASSGLLPASNGATDVVIGVIDTGVYPIDRASFVADPSLPPLPPGKFRGGCVTAPSFNASAYCNGKLVGAKAFYEGYEAELGHPMNETEESRSPLDTEGHGTHTASTAAGSAVGDAAFYGYARGKAVGMAPGARIASYKVFWKYGSKSSDILAAFDEAIADGVDVISASIGDSWASPFDTDSITVGAFNAVRKGILVSASAGNSGPDEFSAVNVAPWFLTVGASTINRRFPADVVLGNGDTFSGASLYAGSPLGTAEIPLIYGRTVGSETCEPGKLNASLVGGKIVLCDPGVINAVQGEAVKLAGGVGAIFTSTKEYGELVLGSPQIIPATTVTFAAAKKIRKYISKNTFPVATIVFHGTVIDPTLPSPRMASFSGRGPNFHAREILKPDITAPGVEILAAWTGASSPSGLEGDTRRVEYNMLSGTSMSCPHVSGIAALLRQARPEWSPAAIKSAMMTTAYNVDSSGGVIVDMATGKASTPFARGAGHVDPNRAVDPGLVYDAGAEDYIAFLCALGYTDDQIAIFTRDGSATNCSAHAGSSVAVGDLNYPAFAAVFSSRKLRAITQRRVGSNTQATYNATVTSPAGTRVTVKPHKLRFTATQQTQEYLITFTRAAGSVKEAHTFGSIAWTDGEHTVTSPIAITWPSATKIAEI